MTFSKKRLFGNFGEELVCRYLLSKGYSILERNYLKKVGEIDVVASRKGELHFVEVKTARIGTQSTRQDRFRPEDNVHPRKLQRLSRTVELYLQEKQISPDTPWQIDVVVVCINSETKKATVRFLENVNAG